MVQTAFTRTEARGKVGKRVRARLASPAVPKGAVGTITAADRVIDGYDVEVTWRPVGSRTPWVDWYTKEEYEARLIEMP